MKTRSSSPDTTTWLLGDDTLAVVPLTDPLIEALGYDARSAYAEAYWLGVIGPSALCALRRLNADLDRHPGGFGVSLPDLASELGLGHGPGRNTPVVRTLCRLVTFGLATIQGDALAVRRSVPPLTRRHLRRLPIHLVERHQAETTRTAGPPAVRLTA